MTRNLVFSSGRTLALDPWCLMGILNATPDSFSDGGVHLDPTAAVRAGLRMLDEGATVLDVGGESTRPGAARVSASDQCARVLPILKRLRAETNAVLSIDTTLAIVAEAALDAGAEVINDVAAGQEAPRIFDVAAERGAAIVLMHRLVPPGEDRYSTAYATAPKYGDVVEEVCSFLVERVAAARARGVEKNKIILDPGFGFGKSVEQNLELLERINEVVRLGFPVLAGLSRKSFLAAIGHGDTPEKRSAGSVEVAVAAWDRGVSILRVHEPAAHRDGLLRSPVFPRLST